MANTKSLWLRLYTEILNDPKVQRLPDSLFRAYINFLCIAKEYSNDGVLPPKKDIAFFLRCPENSVKKFCDGLEKAELLDADGDTFLVHGWNYRQYESDNDPTANMRKRRQRERIKTQDVTRDVTDMSRVTSRQCHENVTRTEIEIEKEKEEDKYKSAHVETLPASFRIQESLLAPIRATFEHFNPQGFTSPAIEDPAIVDLAEKFSRLGRDNPGDFARVALEKFYALTVSGDKFWSSLPFTPSTLNNPKILDRVIAMMKTAEKDDASWVDALEKQGITA